MNYKLILFDADGVLVKSDRSVSDALYKKYDLTDEDMEPTWAMYPELMAGKKTTDEFLDAFASEHNIPRSTVSSRDFTDAYMHALEIAPGIEELLDKLSKKFRLALLSDTSEMIHASRRELKLFSYFDTQFLSYESGHLKPSEHAFHVVLRHHDLRPSEVFFIDDRASNVDAAKQLGIDGTVFTNTEALIRSLEARGIL